MRRFVFFCIELLLICPLFGDFKPGVATAPTLSLDYVIPYGENGEQKITIEGLLEEGLQETLIKKETISPPSSGDRSGGENGKIVTNFSHAITKHVKYIKEAGQGDNSLTNDFILIEEIDACLKEKESKLQTLAENAADFWNKFELPSYSTVDNLKRKQKYECFLLAAEYILLQTLRLEKMTRLQVRTSIAKEEEETIIQMVIQNTKNIDQRIQKIEKQKAIGVFQQLAEINHKLEETEKALFTSITSKEISQQLRVIEQQLNEIIPMLSNNAQEKCRKEMTLKLEDFSKEDDTELNQRICKKIEKIEKKLEKILEIQNKMKQFKEKRIELFHSPKYSDRIVAAKVAYLKTFARDCVLNTNAIIYQKTENPVWTIDPSPEESLVFYTRLQIPGGTTKYFILVFRRQSCLISPNSPRFQFVTAYTLSEKELKDKLEQAQNNAQTNYRLIYEDYKPLAENPPSMLPPTEIPMIAAQTPNSHSMKPKETPGQSKKKTTQSTTNIPNTGNRMNSKQQTSAKRGTQNQQFKGNSMNKRSTTATKNHIQKPPAPKVERPQQKNPPLFPNITITSKIQKSPAMTVALPQKKNSNPLPPADRQAAANAVNTNNALKPLEQITPHKITVQKPNHSSNQPPQATKTPTGTNPSVTSANNAPSFSVGKRKTDKLQITTPQNSTPQSADSKEENSTT